MTEWVNAKIEIRNLGTDAPTYYLNALLEHIKKMVENELNNAPDMVVDSYEDTNLIVEIVKEGKE